MPLRSLLIRRSARGALVLCLATAAFAEASRTSRSRERATDLPANPISGSAIAESGPETEPRRESEPAAAAPRLVGERRDYFGREARWPMPYMSWGADMFNPNWPEATAFVHLCAADIGPIQSADVYTNHGVVNDGAFAQCDPGYTGRGFSVSWSNAHGPILLEGSNSFWGNICDANGQCGGGSGELVYTPPKDSGVTILPQATLKATVDQWDTLRFTISDTDSRGPFVYDSVTLSCEMSSCQRIGSSVSVPLGGSNSVSVRFRATATGAHPFSLRYCRAVGFGPEIWSCTHYYTDNVVAVPASPVARKIQVSALNAPFYRQSGTGPTSVPFRVKNTGTDSTTIQFSAVCPTTVTAAGCTHPASAKLNADESITVNLAFTPTAPGTSVHGTLTLTGSALGEVVSAQAGVEVGPTDGVTPQVTLTLAGLNPEGSVSRDQCLSIAAGDAAGVECGALRLVHAIQGIQTMGRQRDLSFSYVSTHARATALVAANVSIVNAATDSVRATLQVSGLSALTRTYAWPSACRGVACRLVFPIPADSLGIATGWRTYSLQVNAFAGGSSVGTATATGGVAIVNRVTSPFGAGWWLQGLEQLVSVHDTLKLWVGGDGSTRLYRRTAADTNVFLVVHAVSRPDTLQRSGTTWIRRLPNGAQTRFDNAGLHTRTLSALSDTTEFIYASGTLDEIRLPRPNGTLLPRVKFVYTGSGSSRRLVTVRIRTGASSDSSGERVTTMYRSQTWRLDSIQDPDGRRVRFRADSATRRVLVRRNRLMDSTRFDYNAFGGIDSVTQFIPGDSNAVTRICAAETRSLVACGWVTSSVGGVPLPQSVTKIDGPRRGTFDVTTLVLNRWGGADTIIAPDGGTTRLVRDAVFPALVVKSTNPIGFEQLATYNARGLPVTTTAVNPVGLNQNAVTRYAWHPVWNLPDTVIPPLGAAQHFRNNANRPVVDSQWVVGHDSTKVRFTYDSRLRPTHVTTPLGGFERIHYDVLLGNVRAQRAGTDTMTVMRDRFGRDSVVIGTDASIRTDIFYDAMSRVDSTRTTAVGLGATTLPRSGITVSAASTVLRVSQVYDAEGNVLSVSRLDTTNQAANTGVGTSFSYDAARRVKSRSENGRTDSFAYNAAGQQTRHITARGHTIEQGYDAAGRLQYRLVPGVVTSRTTCQVCAWHPLYSAESFPYFPTSIDDSSSPDMVIPGTVRIWSYDRAGRDLTAGTYYADGSLKTRDGITMVRDLLGRVTEESAYFEKQWYSYHPALGHMSQTRAWKHFASDTATVNFSYDAAGRQVSRNVPGLAAPLGEARLFDSNGRTVRRRAHAAGSTPLFEDSLVYNNRGLVTLRRSGSSDPALADTAQMYYNGMGALIAVDRVRLYGGQGVNSDEYVVDGLGNRLSSHANRGRSTGNLKQTSAYNGDNQLSTSDSPQYGVTANGVPVVSQYDEVSISRDASGNETARVRTRFFWDSLLPPAYRTVAYGTEVTRHWYDAEQRLRATQTTENKNGEKGRTTFTRYRYDQFGRRVEIRVQRDTTTCVANDRDNLPECLGSVHTFKWFGDQIVSETRLSLGGSAPNNHFGTVHYVHAGGIDQPLFVISGGAYIVPHTSGRGGFEAGTYLNGTPVPSWKYHWPARTQGVFLGGDVRMQADPEIGWLGSLMDGKTDPSGLQYMRNRYYDPATGRFTQPDPIGLAGGLNLYGYAGGDPINLSDPFGLCPEWKTGVPCISPIASPMRPANSSEPSGVGGSEYGWTRSGGKQFHNGFDHAAEAGTAIVAPGDATVTAGRSTIGGNFLVMDLGNGTSVTVLHAEGFDAGLEVGKSVQVKAGTQVGRVGRTGNAANSPRETHGHVITRSGGKTCNPRDFFSKDGGGGSCQ